MQSVASYQADGRISGVRMLPRVACVQNGDFKLARSRIDAGLPEPYFGMRESVRAVDRLLAGREGLVVSLDGPPSRDALDQLTLVSLDEPPAWVRIGRIRAAMKARAVIAELEAFRPSHVLLRVGGAIGLRVAEWCAQRRVPTVVLLANAVYGDSAYSRRMGRALMAQLNDPVFLKVGNYKATACASMIEYGLTRDKAVSYAFAGERSPSACAPKRLDRRVCRLVFAGRMVIDKGPLELIEAISLLRALGIDARATMFGEGKLLERVRARALTFPEGVIETPGVVDNQTLFQALREATFACVPTRSRFVEGMPMALTEALAARTPVIASNCHVFKSAFRDGEGVRLFQEQDAQDLAETVAEVFADPTAYYAISQRTEAAFRRVAAEHSFSEVLEGFRIAIDETAE
jgi:hypothetical protein